MSMHNPAHSGEAEDFGNRSVGLVGHGDRRTSGRKSKGVIKGAHRSRWCYSGDGIAP